MIVIPCNLVHSDLIIDYSRDILSGGATYNGGKKLVLKSSSISASTSVTAPAPIAKSVALPTSAASSQKINRAAEQENTVPKINRSLNSNNDVDAIMQENAVLKASNVDAEHAYGELRTEMEGLEKERDFYFEKLRDIEILLQDIEDKGEGSELTASIFKILYATADGFEQLPSTASATQEASGNELPLESY